MIDVELVVNCPIRDTTASDPVQQHVEFPENSFDGVYAMTATVHAPSLQGIYEEVYRVLKPDGAFGVFELVMDDNYNNDNPYHHAIR